MNKKDIQTLKTKHRLELVMQEGGEILEADDKHSELLRSRTTPGLVVNIRTQTFELTGPDKNTKAGDVLAWLQHSYSWTFPMALKYLQNRPEDPRLEAKETSVKLKPIVFEQTDYVTTTIIYADPNTGRQDLGFTINYNLMDELQKRAFDIAHVWIVRYFGKSSHELWGRITEFPSRFKPVIDFSIDKCACCENPFDWMKADMVAFAQEKSEYITIYGSSGDGKTDFTGELAETDELYIDQDFVICEKCLRETYAPRYAALRLCRRSALRRERRMAQEQNEVECSIREEGREKNLADP